MAGEVLNKKNLAPKILVEVVSPGKAKYEHTYTDVHKTYDKFSRSLSSKLKRRK
jgi:hypothetical protein